MVSEDSEYYYHQKCLVLLNLGKWLDVLLVGQLVSQRVCVQNKFVGCGKIVVVEGYSLVAIGYGLVG